jgi:hypothetical protein
MPLQPPRDLEPRYDVKGGSPRTPSGGVRVAEYQQYANPSTGDYHGFWRTVAVASWGLMGGLLLAWFTALQSKGVTHQELQDYEEKYSPYIQQREIIAKDNRNQDTQIGALQAIQNHNVDKLNSYEGKFHDVERDVIDLQAKVKLFADYVEAQRIPKK